MKNSAFSSAVQYQIYETTGIRPSLEGHCIPNFSTYSAFNLHVHQVREREVRDYMNGCRRESPLRFPTARLFHNVVNRSQVACLNTHLKS